MQAKVQGNDGHTDFTVDVPEVLEHGQYDGLYKAGEWSFDIREESDAQKVLEAIGSWIAWYRFLLREE